MKHSSLKSIQRGIREKVWLLLRLISELGLWGGIKYLYYRTFGARSGTYSVHPRNANYALHLRHSTSDSAVFNQIFLRREYEPLLDMNAKLILDCGANVGYSSAFFLSHFPSCNVIAVEPDAGNYEMLQRNLQPYGDRAKILHAGIWSHNTPLKIIRGNYGDSQEWSFQVRTCEAHESPEFIGLSIDSILNETSYERISLLKIDIEGAEAIVFANPVLWINRIDAIAIELHDDSHFGNASDLFYSAIREREFEVTRFQELTICRRPNITVPERRI